jgi:hypothetical protein
MFMKFVLAPTLLALASVSFAQSAAQAPKKSPRPATPHEQVKSEAKGLALASEVVESITERQLEIAGRVLTGKASCELDQQVSIQAVNGKPGYFQVGFKTATYIMTPEETTSGAVRLMDKKAGVVWLQIPTKSMLMNSKIGQRLVDNCTQVEQRVASTTQ